MALARVKVWNPGDVLTAADLNGEFNNELNNPITLISPTTGPINFNLQAHTGLLPSVITASSGVPGQALVASTAAASAPIFASLDGSRVKGLNGALTSQTGTFTADQYVLQTTAGVGGFVLNSTSPFTVNIGSAGPAVNGRDIAGAFASTYIHWYCITTGPNSTTPAGLVSSNPPTIGPVALPAGYSLSGYLGGSIYSSASTTLTNPHRFRGSYAAHDTRVVALAGGSATSETSIVLSAIIPANSIRFTAQHITVAGGTAVRIRTVSGSDYEAVGTAQNGSFEMTMPAQLALLYAFDAAGGNYSIAVHGYTMPNGDV